MRLRRLEPVLRRALRGPCAVPPGSRVLVAVSGGADSTALLLGLRRLARELEIVPCAAHLHHGLRRAEADRDREFVRDLCARLGVPLESARWNTHARMLRRGLSGQAGLRTLRREFLASAARRAGAATIATAHTADDQAETVLLRLLRGTGLPGLGGMSPRRGIWIKPLLEATRRDIEADLTECRQSWREDSSNADLEYTRNRIRHQVIPALLGRGVPGAGSGDRASLARRMADATREIRSVRQSLETGVSLALAGICRIEGDEITLDSREVASYPMLFQRTLFRQLWSRVFPGGPGLTRIELQGLGGLAGAGRGGRSIDLPGGWRAGRDRGLIRFIRQCARPLPGRARLSVPGRTRSGEVSVRGRWLPGSGALRRLPGKGLAEEFFAADGLEGVLELRAARADESFVPFGRRRPVRVGRFLSKQGVSLPRRSRPRVLADAGGVLWVVGVRRSARAPVTSQTRTVLWVHAEHHD